MDEGLLLRRCDDAVALLSCMEAVALIEIASLKYPLRLRGRVAEYEWQMFGKGDHWVFYIEDAWFGQCCGEQIWALTAKYPAAEQMPQILAIHIADACARQFAKILATVDLPIQ